jgi:polar amino acid transport system substrate-binding protein
VSRHPVAAALLAALALGAGAAAAHAATPATATPGTLTVGLNLPSDGFQVGAVQGRTVVAARGFEIDLAQAIEGRLGLQALAMVQEPVFTRLLAPGPKAWDMALAQVTITAARTAGVDFSVPYLTADQGVLLSLQTTARPASIADLKGLRLCAQKGSTGADLIAQRIRPASKPTLPNSVTVLTRGLRSGACHAVVFDAPTLATLRAAVPGRFGPMAGIIPTGERYGVVFPKGATLRGPVNRAIAALKKDGTLAALQKKWLAQDLATVPVLR